MKRKPIIPMLMGMLMFLTLAHQINAQNFIGKSERDILEFMSKYGKDKSLKEHAPGKGIMYAHNEPKGVFTIYNIKNGVCENYAVLYPKELLSMVVKAYNETYIKQSKNEWVDKDLTLKLTLHIDEGEIMAMIVESLM